jgi:hypothetical protein
MCDELHSAGVLIWFEAIPGTLEPLRDLTALVIVSVSANALNGTHTRAHGKRDVRHSCVLVHLKEAQAHAG